MGLSVGAAIAGLGMALEVLSRCRQRLQEPIAEAAPPVYTTLLNKYYVDEAYDYVFTGRRKVGGVRLGVMGLGEASSWFDAHVIDGAVNGAGWITRVCGTISSWWDKWIIDGLLGKWTRDSGADCLVSRRALLQWGLVQWYALVMVAGLGRIRVVLRSAVASEVSPTTED